MFSHANARDDSSMVLEVRFDSDDPPCGSVRRRGEDDDATDDGGDERPVAFTGWLGLLAALSELTRPAQ